MTNAPGSTGTTVTLFGASDRLDHALGTQLEQRGCRTHLVTVPTGWLRTATHAILRLDTDAGAEALRELARTPEPRSHVIAVAIEPADPSELRRVQDMCRECGAHHNVSLIWHAPLAPTMVAPPGEGPGVEVSPQALAVSVADELVEHTPMGQPSFVMRPFPTDAHH